MSTFKSIIVVKHPPALVGTTLRDRLPELVPLLDDIQGVTVVERHEELDGGVRLVNRWKADPPIPELLASLIDRDRLEWTDEASWNRERDCCQWRITPRFLTEQTRCTGVTRYEPAIGGRGTRITLEGQLDVSVRSLPGITPLLEGAVATGIESFVATLIPQNFRKLTQALSTFLSSNA